MQKHKKRYTSVSVQFMQAMYVIQVLLQWLVRYLIKHLMQLMTVETLVEHRTRMPSSYLKSYLDGQAHFSLKDLICLYMKDEHHERSVYLEYVKASNK